MMKNVKKRLKNERGLTLIELLAVVVILGIISAIAIPSIGGLIDNSRKDAHVGNAQQMINSAKTAIAGDSNLIPTNGEDDDITLGELISDGYIDSLKDPDKTKDGYDETNSKVIITNEDNQITYSVTLINSERGIGKTTTVEEKDLNRDSVE